MLSEAATRGWLRPRANAVRTGDGARSEQPAPRNLTRSVPAAGFERPDTTVLPCARQEARLAAQAQLTETDLAHGAQRDREWAPKEPAAWGRE